MKQFSWGGGNFPGDSFLGGLISGGFFPGGIFPDTLRMYSGMQKTNIAPIFLQILDFEILSNLTLFSVPIGPNSKNEFPLKIGPRQFFNIHFYFEKSC